MEQENQKPLTLNELIKYNQEVLFSALEERFLTKAEFRIFKKEFNDFKNEVSGFKQEFKDFKNESLTNQDATLKKLDILLEEKEMRQYQEQKHKKLWSIIIRALKEHRILSPQDLEQIAHLEIF